MSKGGSKDQGSTTTTATVGPDPASQAFIDQLRQQALQAAGVATGRPLAGPGGGVSQATPRNIDPAEQFRNRLAGFNPGDPGGSGGIRPNVDIGPGGGVLPPGTERTTPPPPIQAGAVQDPNSFFVGPDQRPISEQIDPFLDPFLQDVIGGVRGEFNTLRDRASTQAQQQATAANAFGGSRQAVLEGTRLGELDRAQTSQIGGLLSRGFTSARDTAFRQNELNRQLQERQLQEPLFRQRQALDFLNLGLGPVGQSTTGTTSAQGPGGSRLGAAAGGAVAGSAFGLPGIIGGGLLGGIFG